MEKPIEEVPPDLARKKSHPICERKREKQRIKTYSAPDLPQRPNCGHNATYKCTDLSMADIAACHKKFYAIIKKTYQDDFIIKYCHAEDIKRQRIRTGTGNSKAMSLTYYLQKTSGEKVRVCRQTFLRVLQINKGRVRGVLKRHKVSGMMASETRGGDRKHDKFVSIKNKIIDFIKQFKGTESHYCRSKSRRIYLPSELNISKMHKMFIKDHEHCKESLFRKVFNTKFNIGFSTPRSDMCSKCLEYKEKIKLEKNEEEKFKLQAELNVHVTRGKTFFKFLQDEDPSIMTLSFDCEKNQNLPKVPDQATYYARQLYIYNFTIVKGTSHANLTRNNVYTYTWTENEHAKGSNEIGSAIYHCLTTILNYEGIKTLRLMCDGCSGQNKNSIIIAMLSKWLSSNAPANIKRVELIFPVTGHSFIPPDRVFGTIEKEIKARNTIIDPNEYISIFQEHATVFKLGGEDVPVYDWKNGKNNIQKEVQDLHFKIKQCKRIIFGKLKRDNRAVVVRGEEYYNNDIGLRKCITKAGKLPCDVNPPIIPKGVPVKKLKIRDVNRLLCTHFGPQWMEREELKFYKEVIFQQEEMQNIAEVEEQAQEQVELQDEEQQEERENQLCDEYSAYEPPTTLI